MALAVLLIVTSSGVTFALWTSKATVGGTATTATISLTSTNFESINKVYENHSLVKTGSFTVKNTTVSSSPTAMPVAVVLDRASGAQAFAQNLDVRVWGPVANIATCTDSASPSGTDNLSGTWGSPLTLNTTLSAQQSKSWCFRSSTDERGELASATGTQPIAPRITATLTVGGWVATATQTAAQSTSQIFPAATLSADFTEIVNANGMCVDVTGSNSAAGTTVIQYPCHGGDNQLWSAASAGSGYYSFAPKHSTSRRLTAVGTTVGSGATIQDAAVNANQQWQVQQRNDGTYQLVQKITGLCLQSPGSVSTTQFVLGVCDGGNAQKFTFPIPVTALTCSDSNPKDRNLYSWNYAATTPYTLSIAGTSVTKTAAAGAQSITVNEEEFTMSNGTYDVEVRDGSGVLRHNGTIRVRDSGDRLNCD